MVTIAITGTIGAGKGTVVEYLQTKGWRQYSARQILIQELRKDGLALTRDNMTTKAQELRKRYGPGYIIGELLKHAQEDAHKAKTSSPATPFTGAIIESVRAVGEVTLLREYAERVYLLAVDASIERRYQRIVARGSSTDHVTFEKFVEDEQKEFNNKEPWSNNLKACIIAADFVIRNDGTVPELQHNVDEFLAKIASIASK
jgi:dephospho-CoA kinase